MEYHLETSAKIERFKTTDEWQGARHGGIGASEIAAVLGVSRYRSPLQLYYEKTAELGAARADSEYQVWGRKLEGLIVEHYGAETRREVHRDPEGVTLLRHPEHEFLVCTLDASTAWRPGAEPLPEGVSGVGPVEVKNTHFLMGRSWLDDQEPPLEYQVQLQAQLLVTGFEWGSIAALIGGCKFVWIDQKRDDALIALIIAAAEKFWRMVCDRTPPPADGSEQTTALLKALYPRSTGETVALPAEALAWDVNRIEGAEMEKIGEARKELAENLLKQAIGEATFGQLPTGVRYSWKDQTRKEYVSAATSFRVLRRHEEKSKALKGAMPALEPAE